MPVAVGEEINSQVHRSGSPERQGREEEPEGAQRKYRSGQRPGVSVTLTPSSSGRSQKRQQSNASRLRGRTVPNLELRMEPNYPSGVRDELQTFPNTQDFKHSLPRYPFLRKTHELEDPQERREGKMQNNYATG